MPHDLFSHEPESESPGERPVSAPTPGPAAATHARAPLGPPAILLSRSQTKKAPAAGVEKVRAEEVIKRPGSGEPLQPQVRATLEKSLGEDLRSVRVHRDRPARAAADSLGARAFTHGPHIFLGSGQNPANTRLMAHEVAHVIQQKGRPGLQTSTGSASTDGLEREAETVAAVVQRGGQARVSGHTGGARVQGSFWSAVKGAVAGAVSGIAQGAKAIAGTVVGAAQGIAKGLSTAWSIASKALGSAAAWAWAGLQTLGSELLTWLTKASSAVWSAIKWFGNVAWDAIKWLGVFLWEKLSLMGALAWSFISNTPKRLWRIIVHGWEGIKGAAGWLATGLKGAVGWARVAVWGVLKWLASGLEGALNWLTDGLAGAAAWAVDFVMNPSLAKLWSGLLASMAWFRKGITGFVKWGWDGIVAAAIWVWQGMKGLASWLWTGFLGGVGWYLTLGLYLLELVGTGERLQLWWGLIFRLRRLKGAEVAASLEVHKAGQIPYWQIRVDDNSIVSRIGKAAVTTMHVLHFPKGGVDLDVVVHELTHVAQYENAGAIYMPQALHAQHFTTAKYDYGNLTLALASGKHFSSFNREQQAQICQDYYVVKHGQSPEFHATETELLPFILEMQAGRF